MPNNATAEGAEQGRHPAHRVRHSGPPDAAQSRDGGPPEDTSALAYNIYKMQVPLPLHSFCTPLHPMKDTNSGAGAAHILGIPLFLPAQSCPLCGLQRCGPQVYLVTPRMHLQPTGRLPQSRMRCRHGVCYLLGVCLCECLLVPACLCAPVLPGFGFDYRMTVPLPTCGSCLCQEAQELLRAMLSARVSARREEYASSRCMPIYFFLWAPGAVR